MKLFNKEELSDDEKKIRAIIVLGLYAVFVVTILLLTSGNKNNTKSNINQYDEKLINTMSIYTRLNKYIKSDDYNVSIKINNLNNYSLNYNVKNNTITGTKVFNNIKTEYMIKNNYYYIKENNNYKKVNTLNLYENYDDTFLNVDNISNLLKDIKETNITKTDEFTNESFFIDLQSLLDLYNDINLTNYTDLNNITIENNVSYDKDNFIIDLNLNEYNKVISKTNNNLNYNIKITKND